VPYVFQNILKRTIILSSIVKNFKMTLQVFLSIFNINSQKEIVINASDFLMTIGVVISSNLLILQIYTFKKFA